MLDPGGGFEGGQPDAGVLGLAAGPRLRDLGVHTQPDGVGMGAGTFDQGPLRPVQLVATPRPDVHRPLEALKLIFNPLQGFQRRG